MKMFKNTVVGLIVVAGLAFGVAASEGGAHLEKQKWSFNGPFGTFDKASAQRGFQVYREVCASCHALKYFKFRNLEDIGYEKEMIGAFAAEYEVPGDIDEAGDATVRAGLPQDAIPSPFANENAARASNGGALPPDLSLITKARAHGPDYVYNLLTGFGDAPDDIELRDGLHYNPFFKGSQIAMAEPISDDLVEYQDGTPATKEQIAKDITMFLTWAGEPKLEARHVLGLRVLLYLLAFTILAYFSMKKIWAPVKRGEDVWGDK
mgnify:CR=1 FL=1